MSVGLLAAGETASATSARVSPSSCRTSGSAKPISSNRRPSGKIDSATSAAARQKLPGTPRTRQSKSSLFKDMARRRA